MFVLIAAVGRNRELGYQGRLCFHLEADMRFFRQTTSGHPVVMGRKTWDSLPKKLENRQNIVISRHFSPNPPYQPGTTLKPPESPENGLKTQNACAKTPKNPEKPLFSAENPASRKVPDQIISDLDRFISEREDSPEQYFIIGGGEIYRRFLPHAAIIYLTEIDASAPADTFFPPFDPAHYTKTVIKKGSENGVNFIIAQYVKK